MNKERLKKLLYDLDTTTKDLNKSLELVKRYSDNAELKSEFSNSLKYSKWITSFFTKGTDPCVNLPGTSCLSGQVKKLV